MARTRATIHCAIHADPDWLALSPEAKLVYITITSQPTVSLAGCLDYNPAKWAKHTGYDNATTAAAVSELTAARFLVVDDDTFEAVIRTFTVYDVGPKANRNTILGVVSAWRAILSSRLRQVVLEAMPARLREAAAGSREASADTDDEPDSPSGDRTADGTDGHVPETVARTTDRTGDGAAVVTVVGTVARSTSTSTSTSTDTNAPSGQGVTNETTPVPTDESPPPAARDRKYPAKFEEFWRRYPRKVAKPAAAKAFAAALKRAVWEDILIGLDRHLGPWQTYPEEIIPHAATWLNGDRWQDPPPQARAAPRSTDRTAANRAKIETSLARIGGSR